LNSTSLENLLLISSGLNDLHPPLNKYLYAEQMLNWQRGLYCDTKVQKQYTKTNP